MDNLFFYSSKVIWKIVSPDNLYLILLSLTILMLASRYQQSAKKWLLWLLLLAWLVAVFPVGNWLYYPLEKQFDAQPQLPQKVDGIIVLGGSVIPSLSQYWNQLETNRHHERLSQFILLAKQYPNARLVFSGGNAGLTDGLPGEAGQVKDYFIQSGIPEHRLLMEDKARNSYENALLSKRLIQPVMGEKWILITSAYHMPRSVGIFCQQGWPVIPYPVDHASQPDELFIPDFRLADHAADFVEASHEWIGLLAYYLTGKIEHLIPGNCS